jgi:hypothetical protein
MPSQHLFDHRYGKGALDRLRSMLDDPASAYQDIAEKFDLTRQRIAQIANELGVNGRRGQRERSSRRRPHIIKRFEEYTPDIRAVMNKLRRTGLGVTPYNSPQPSMPTFFSRYKKWRL